MTSRCSASASRIVLFLGVLYHLRHPDREPRIYWYSLYDLPREWGATTRHKGVELLQTFPYGADPRRRYAEAGARAICAVCGSHGADAMVPFRGSSPRRGGGLDEAAGSQASADGAALGRCLPAGGARLVRPADGRAGRFRFHGHLLLHARASRGGAAPYQRTARARAVRRILCPDGAWRAGCSAVCR